MEEAAAEVALAHKEEEVAVAAEGLKMAAKVAAAERWR